MHGPSIYHSLRRENVKFAQSRDGMGVRVLRTATFQELTDLLSTYDMKRDLIELNYKAAQWRFGAVRNCRYMEPKPGKSMRQIWRDREADVNKKVTNSRQVTDNDLRRAQRQWPASPLHNYRKAPSTGTRNPRYH
jgi:hypothetical protein